MPIVNGDPNLFYYPSIILKDLDEFVKRFGLTEHPAYARIVELVYELEDAPTITEEDKIALATNSMPFLEDLNSAALEKKGYEERINEIYKDLEYEDQILIRLAGAIDEATESGKTEDEEFVLMLMDRIIGNGDTRIYPYLALLTVCFDWKDHSKTNVKHFGYVLKEGIEKGCFDNSGLCSLLALAIRVFLPTKLLIKPLRWRSGQIPPTEGLNFYNSFAFKGFSPTGRPGTKNRRGNHEAYCAGTASNSNALYNWSAAMTHS